MKSRSIELVELLSSYLKKVWGFSEYIPANEHDAYMEALKRYSSTLDEVIRADAAGKLDPNFSKNNT